ncbi:major facilitator superfamily domain-containing protein [Coniochaeta sp. 2T2.1]|nr:major facilitator superfamily domain-containing protein [Coniochaeta sp. 2T2.1]
MSDAEKQTQQAAPAVTLPATLLGPTTERAATSTTPDESAKPVQNVHSKEVRNSSDEDLEPVPHVHLRTYLAVFAVCLIYFAQVFALVGAGSQGQVIAGIFGRTQDASWITAVIAIMTVVLGPIVSQASDYWGRKWFLIVLTLVGAAGAVIVSRAHSMSMIIAGFSVIGIDFGVQPLLHTVASEVLPRRWRAWGQAAVTISNALGLITGLIVGGHFNRHGDPNGFRYFFYIAAATFALAAPYASTPTTAYTFNEKLAKLDWIGYTLLSSSLVLFCVGLSYSQNPYQWSDARVSASFAIGMGFGLGMTLITLITAAQLSIPVELVSVATGLIISVRSLGGTVGIAIYNTVFISAMKKLPGKVAHAAIAAGLPPSSVERFVTDLAGQNSTDLVTVPGVTPEIIGAGAGALLDTYATGFRNVWVTALAFCVLAGISSVFLFDPSKEFNNHIDAPVEKDDELYASS